MVSCQQLGNLSATIQRRGNYKKTTTRSIGRNWPLVGKKKKKIENIDWPSMSPDIAPIDNVWQILKTKLRKKKVYNLSIFGLGNKTRMEGTTKEFILKPDT